MGGKVSVSRSNNGDSHQESGHRKAAIAVIAVTLDSHHFQKSGSFDSVDMDVPTRILILNCLADQNLQAAQTLSLDNIVERHIMHMQECARLAMRRNTSFHNRDCSRSNN